MSSRNAPLVDVLPLAGVGKLLTYCVPPPLDGLVVAGQLVQIPLQRRVVPAVVWDFVAGPRDGVPRERLRGIVSIVQPLPVLNPALRELAQWVARYYSASLESVLETMVPAPVRAGARAKAVSLLQITRRPEPGELEALARRAPKQAALLHLLAQQTQPLPRALLERRVGAQPQATAALVRRGLARLTSAVTQREAYADELGAAEVVATQSVELNAEQQVAVEAIVGALAAGGYRAFLLQGVTGSGKTEVYLRAIERVAAEGGGVIYLVPEVALTPQTVGRLRQRLEARGVRTLVWHSSLSDGERRDAWSALASGEARVVVGARSAVFAPVRNLRLVIVDEEHEAAYKQEETPRYNGRDVAVYRARLEGAVAVLGSATPALESHANALSGKYTRLRLNQRATALPLPFVHVVDLRRERLARHGGDPVLSRLLVTKLRERVAAREQAILFLNRRGFSTALVCGTCGHVEGCEHCSVPLVYHRFDETVRCHLCGMRKTTPLRCPKCGAPDFRQRGHGTQRVEEAVRRAVPGARVERVDTDTMARRNRLRTVLGEFRRGAIDVLVGTQMIAKGLDFPNVTLVGLIDACSAMHLPDFRGAERAFQLIVQVAGRAGRGDRAGEVVLQTFSPELPAVQFGRRAEVDAFLEEELRQRAELGYPPSRHLVRQLFSGRNDEKVAFFAERWARLATERLGDSAEVRGPAPAPLERVEDLYRYQIWYFTHRPIVVSSALRNVAEWESPPDDVRITIDVDPLSVL